MKILQILIYLNLLFLQSYLVRFNLGGYPSNLQEVLIGLAAITFLALIIKKKAFISTLKNLSNYKVLSFFVVGTIIFSTLRPIISQADLLHYLKFTFFAILLTFIALETFKTDQERKNLLRVGGYGALAFGIFSLIFNLTGHNVALDQRLLGPLDAAVYLGYYLTPFFIFFAIETIGSQSHRAPQRGTNIHPIFPAIALGLLMIATRSMGSIAGSFAVIAIYLFTQSNLAILKTRTTKIILAITALIILSVITYTKILPTLKYENSSLDERGEIWQTSAFLLENPSNLLFGLGLGQFQENYANNAKQVLGHEPLDYIVLQPHNIFLLFIFNYGIFGLIALLFFIWKIAGSVRNLATQSHHPHPSLPAQSLATFIVLYFLLHGLIDTPFFKNDMLILLMLFAETVMLTSRTKHG